ncbi:MAG: class I SAM-dependent methyltransferase [Amylibacter sp.]|nr:class I SAM-dependent methyltransferase [Amylibacter sp.]
MADQKTIETYNATAGDYVKLVSRDTPDKDLQRFIDAIPKGGLVLDWGCGPGNSAAMMQTAGLVANAIDASEKMVELARAELRLNVKQGTFDDLNEKARYDGLWANFSLLHAPKSSMEKHLQAAHTALKKGGYFHIGMKLGTGEKRDKLARMYTYYAEDELKCLIESAGFTIATSRKDAMKGMAGHEEPFIIITAHA